MNDMTLPGLEPAIGDKGWRPTKVHPLAALFPPLSPDDFAALVEDIRENGQRFPIILTEDGTLIDGRMRLKACDAAGIEPLFEFLDEQVDLTAFIWSANGKRRQMRKGQMAMIAAANLWSETDLGNDIETDIATAARGAGVSATRLKEAGAVVRYAPHLVDDAIAGSVTLDSAYKQALANKEDQRWREEGLQLLQVEDRDLAQKVIDEEMTLEEARKILDVRRQGIRAMRDSVFMGLRSALISLANFDKSDALKMLPAQLAADDARDHLAEFFEGGIKEVEDRLVAARKGLVAVEKTWAQVKRGS